MDEKLTGRARQALENAAKDATGLHRSIGPSHILLGILRDPDSIGSEVLKALGVDLRRLRDDLERAARDPAERESSDGVTPAAQRAIRSAIEAARSMGHSYAGTEHLLLGVMREEASVAAGILRAAGLDPQVLLAEIARQMTPVSIHGLLDAIVGPTEPPGAGAMQCQVCHASPAMFHFTEIHNGAMLERHLCKRCSDDLEH